jgi:Lon protease-like protein
MSTRTLPLFPLPLVLFPGETRGLHIFEPRYRQLLADCRSTDGRFGIVPVQPDDLPAPSPGTVGCVARIDQVDPHPDGRADILVSGETRFTIDAYPDTDRLYLVGTVTLFEDTPGADEVSLDAAAADVQRRLATYLKAVSRLTEQMSPTTVPQDAAALSFAAAALIGVDVGTKIHLLHLRSTVERLTVLSRLLDGGTEATLKQIKLKDRAKRNGKRPAAGTGAVGS